MNNLNKIVVLFLMLSMGFVLTLKAQNTDVSDIDNVVYIQPFTVSQGTTDIEIEISMKNTAAIRGLQFDLVLPEGVTPVEEDGVINCWYTDRAPTYKSGKNQLPYHSLDAAKLDDGSYRFLASSIQDKSFDGNDGVLFFLEVKISETLTLGDYPILIKNIKLSETDITKFYTTEEIQTTMTISNAGGFEPYAVLSENNTKLTFYYDDQKTARNGMSVGPFNLGTYDGVFTVNSEWHEHAEAITTVEFDKSFANCKTLFSTDYWFYGFDNLATIKGIEYLKTDNVTSMDGMFGYCSCLTSLDVSGFNTDNVVSLYALFYNCSSLTTLDLSGFNTSKVEYMNQMFYGCSSLTTLDLSGFNTSKVEYMNQMFLGCSALKTIFASSKWSTAAVTNGGYIFNGCTKLVGGKGTVYNENHVDYTYAHVDEGTANPGYFTDKNAPAGPEPYAVLSEGNTKLTFYYDTQKDANGGMSVGPYTVNGNINVDEREWADNMLDITSVVFDPSFADCETIISTEGWFSGFENLQTITGLEYLNTSNVTTMFGMFYKCSSLSSLDVTHFETKNVTNFISMFQSCSGLTNLDVRNFDTSNATTIGNMFGHCYSLESLDLSSFNTAKVEDISWLFVYDISLKVIYVGNGWTTENVTASTEMFCDNQMLVGGAGTTYNSTKVHDYTYAHIDEGPTNPGYFTYKDVNTVSPVDMTSWIQNPNFDTGDVSGWTITSGIGLASNTGYQMGESTKEYTLPDETIILGYYNEATGSWISGFVEAWVPAIQEVWADMYGHLGDGTISQTIKNLPAGYYSLSCDAIAANQTLGMKNHVGIYLFASENETKLTHSISTADAMPERCELLFGSHGGDVTIGLMSQDATANWLAADNFRLMFYGESLDALKEPINSTLANLNAVIADNVSKYGADVMPLVESARNKLDDAYKAGNADGVFSALEEGNDAILYATSSKNAYIELSSAFNALSSDYNAHDESEFSAEYNAAVKDALNQAGHALTYFELSAEEAHELSKTLRELNLQPSLPKGEYVDLSTFEFCRWTAEDAKGEKVSTVGCAYMLNESTGIPYGDGNVNYLTYSDLTGADVLVIVVAEGAVPRPLFNRSAPTGTDPNGGAVGVELPRDEDDGWWTVTENEDNSKTYVIDVKRMTEEFGYCHLHAIKGQDFANLTVSNMLVGYNVGTSSDICQTPVITRDGTSDRIIMTTSTSGASIYYTTDGTEPTEESTLYTGPVTMTFNCTVRAIAVHEELAPSEIREFSVDWLSVYGVTVNYNEGVLSLACATPNSEIRYEIGGKEVTENSTLYTVPITLTDNRVVKYKAFATGLDPVGGSFTPKNFTCAEVTLKSYDGLNVDLTTTEADATIYYTTDGSEPTTSSEVFLGKTPLTGLCTINAMVVKPYKNNSKVLTLPITYFFNGMTVYLAEAGHVEDALQWRGTDGLEELTIECQGKGAVNATDMTFLRTMKELKHLNMANARFENNTAPTGAFSGMNIISVEMPSKNITTMGNVFSGCNHLAAIVWNAQVLMASTATAAGLTNPNLLMYVKNKVYAPQGVQNVVIDGKAGDIVLSDEGSFYCPQSFTAQSISYTHKFSQTTGIDECRGWETIALPFDVQIISHERLGVISPFTATDGSVRKFWLCDLSDDGFIWSDAIKANTPYIISMPNNEAYATPYILTGNIIFESENVTIPVTTLKTSHRGDHVFTPCFDHVEASPMVYAINKNDQGTNFAEGSVFMPNSRTVKPFEAYMSIPTNAVAPRFIPIREDDETGIMELQNIGIMELQNGTYDMTGRKVQGELKRGVYIVNGKKVMVK